MAAVARALFVSVLIGLPGLAWSAEPELRLAFSPEGALRVELVAEAGALVPACRGLELQRFDPEQQRYVSIPEQACGPAALPRAVGEGPLVLDSTARLREGQSVRAVAVVGLGCEGGRPFDGARCKRVIAVESKPLTVPAARGAAD